jgi:hypothetical protein
MIKIIKEFLLFRRIYKYHQTRELNEADKVKLESFDKTVLKVLLGKSYNNLVREILNENISRDYFL